jgi:hypothetical protein
MFLGFLMKVNFQNVLYKSIWTNFFNFFFYLLSVNCNIVVFKKKKRPFTDVALLVPNDCMFAIVKRSISFRLDVVYGQYVQ